jgi:hypothetical protein
VISILERSGLAEARQCDAGKENLAARNAGRKYIRIVRAPYSIILSGAASKFSSKRFRCQRIVQPNVRST